MRDPQPWTRGRPQEDKELQGLLAGGMGDNADTDSIGNVRTSVSRVRRRPAGHGLRAGRPRSSVGLRLWEGPYIILVMT